MKIFLITFLDGSQDAVKAYDYHEDADVYLFRGENGKVDQFRVSQVRSIQETDPSDWQSRGGGSY